MSSVIDSEATFTQQAAEAGLSQPWIDALVASNMATMAKLSFAVTTPGVTASDQCFPSAYQGRCGTIHCRSIVVQEDLV